MRYTFYNKEVDFVGIGKVFENGGSQDVRLPEKYRLNANEVTVQHLGDSLVLTAKENSWETFLNGINGFTDDFFKDGMGQDVLKI